MSGGSLDYIYRRITNAVEEIKERTFGRELDEDDGRFRRFREREER